MSKAPIKRRYEIDEMFSPECVGCLADLFELG